MDFPEGPTPASRLTELIINHSLAKPLISRFAQALKEILYSVLKVHKVKSKWQIVSCFISAETHSTFFPEIHNIYFPPDYQNLQQAGFSSCHPGAGWERSVTSPLGCPRIGFFSKNRLTLLRQLVLWYNKPKNDFQNYRPTRSPWALRYGPDFLLAALRAKS